MPALIYLDNHATTQPDPRVVTGMLPWLGTMFGNAGSKSHARGWSAEAAVVNARDSVAALLGARPGEIVFTAGATEGCNLAIQGLLAGRSGGRIVTTAIEHPAVLDTCEAMKARGFELVVVGTDRHGRVSVEAIAEACSADTVLISVMAANNEIGTIQPIAEIGALAKSRGIVFHCDAAQAIGRIRVNVAEWQCDLLTLSAHKFYGPQGVGALYVRSSGPRVRLAPLMFGGGQENGLRPGTSNVPGIVGLGLASELCSQELEADAVRLRGWRDALEGALREAIPGLRVNGHPEHRLPGNLSLTFPDVEAEGIMTCAPELALSSGAACSSGHPGVSRVLSAIGLTDAEARATVRVGLGRFTTADEVERARASLVTAHARALTLARR